MDGRKTAGTRDVGSLTNETASRVPAVKACSVCGGPLSRSAKVEVCRSNSNCLRINTSLHNFRKTRKQKTYAPCANCGGDWSRASRGEKLCGDCRETVFWCTPGKHVTSLTIRVSVGVCRACRLVRRAKERAQEHGVPFTLTWEYVESLWPDACPYLGVPLAHRIGRGTGPGRFSPTLDRIDPNRGYVVGNVEIVSHLANSMKSDANPEQLITFAHEVLRRYASANSAPSVAQNG